MTKQVQIRRGTATQHTSFTGAEGEISINTTNDTVHVHDGVAAGGVEMARSDLGNVLAANVAAALAGSTLSSITLTTADINGGTIDSTVIGGTTPAAGTFTSGTFTGDVSFGDNDKAIFGAGSDLQIYHDGSNSYIQDVGTGNLYLGSSDLIWLGSGDFQEAYATFSDNGAVTLYHDNSAKFATTATGINVAGTVTANGLTIENVFSFDNSGFNGEIKTYGSGTGIIYDALNGYHTFRENGTARMQIRAGGDIYLGYEDTGTTPKFFWDASAEALGLGTTSPSEKLQVQGSGTTRITVGNSTVNTTGQTTGIDFEPISNLTNSAKLNVVNGLSPTIASAYTAGFQFITEDYNGSLFSQKTAMTIGASGNVGIGTAGRSASGYTILGVDNATNGGVIEVLQNGTIKGQLFYDGTQTRLRSNLSTDLVLDTNDTERMRINSSGNVGIGTSSPSSNAIVKFIEIEDSTSAGVVLDAARVFSIYSSSSSSLSFRDETASANRMTIDSSGNVGIGTSSPATQLHIQNLSGNSESILGQYGTGTRIQAGAYSNLAIIKAYNGTNDALAFWTGSSERMRIDSSGRVGIGTSSPTALLDLVPATPAASGATDAIKIKEGTKVFSAAFTGSSYSVSGVGPNELWYYGNSSFSALSFGSDAAVPIKFVSNGSERLRIQPTGNVGIGTTSPDTKFHVEESGAADLYATFENSNPGGYGAFVDIKSTANFSFSRFTGGTKSWIIGQRGLAGGAFSIYDQDNSAHRLVIDGIGRLLVNGTSNLYGQSIMQVTSGSNTWTTMRNTDTGSAQQYTMVFARSSSNVGAISTTNTSTIFTTSSDYRLKENVTGITDGIERVKQLAPSRFNFIADGNNTVDGFLAHEVQGVVPEAISGEKDAMRDEEYEVTPAVYEDVVIPAVLDDDGNEIEAERTEQQLVTEAVMGTRSVPDYQGIDQSKLVPLLTAALQEAITKIEDLEERVATLETN